MAAALAVALLVAAAAPARAMDARAVFERAKGAVVVVVAYDSRGKARALGTGFYVGSGGLVATNFHVIHEAASLKIRHDGDDLGDVKEVRAVDEAHDLALLRVALRGEPLELVDGQAPVGTDVVAIGTPKGLEQTLSTGVISGVRYFDPMETGRRSHYYQITAPISPGSSGGPVLDEFGRVLGVSTFIMLGGQNLNFAIPAKYVTELMGKRGSSGIVLDPDTSVSIEKDESGTIHIFSK